MTRFTRSSAISLNNRGTYKYEHQQAFLTVLSLHNHNYLRPCGEVMTKLTVYQVSLDYDARLNE